MNVDPACTACGDGFETMEHVFLECWELLLGVVHDLAEEELVGDWLEYGGSRDGSDNAVVILVCAK